MTSSLKEIAEELHLSISTVSRAINNTGRISPETRRLVMDAVRKHNYAPNRVAQSLRKKKTNIVGLIVPDIGDYFSEVIKGTESELSANNYSMILADSHEDPIKEANYIKLMHQSQVDGLILATVSDDFHWTKTYQSSNIPTIFFDNEPCGLKCNKVVLNNIKATEIAVDHLIKLGHKDIALICGNTKESTAKYRRNGFIEAMEKHNLEINYNLIKEGLYYVDAGYSSMQELILNREEHPFTAVIASTYRLSCSAIHAIKDYGFRYPTDFSFIGFDMEDSNRLFSPSITSVLQPGKQIGKLMVHRLLQSIESSDASEGKEDFVISFVEPMIKLGKSTAPVKEQIASVST